MMKYKNMRLGINEIKVYRTDNLSTPGKEMISLNLTRARVMKILRYNIFTNV